MSRKGLGAEGLSNKEIGARLFITERTVESHLKRIFRKLGIAKRAALAGMLERERISA